jgi:hypothetical protein
VRYGRRVAEAVVVGVVTRTGSAVAVALSGSADTPRFRARLEFGLSGPGLAVQPYHAAAGLDPAAAEQLIGQVGRGAERAAAAGLRSVAALLPAGAVTEVAVLVKAVSVPDRLPDVLRSHAWMHAAEGVLYRRAVLAAVQECGWTPRAVDRSSLPAAAPVLTALGRVAGRPWRQMEKDAARAAIAVLAGPR